MKDAKKEIDSLNSKNEELERTLLEIYDLKTKAENDHDALDREQLQNKEKIAELEEELRDMKSQLEVHCCYFG